MPTLRVLKNNVDTADADAVNKSAVLAAATAAKVGSDGTVTETHHAFAAALVALGGKVVDVSAVPPIVYAATPDGRDFTASTVPSLDDSAPEPVPVPVPVTDPAATPAASP
jgi:hypothetical protein